MKLTKKPTPYSQLVDRLHGIGHLHFDCSIYTGPVAPMMNVLRGKESVVMIAKPPLMAVHYVDKAKVAWLFDAYGQ